MLTTRSVIFAIITIAVLSVVAALVSMLWVGDSQSTLGRDSYGTRTEGYRAVHDLLNALEFRTERTSIPEIPSDGLSTSYVLWNPRDRFVQIEPDYLNELLQWVKEGGYLVVTPSAETENSDDDHCQRCSGKNCSTCIPISLLKELGLKGVAIEEVELWTGIEDDIQEDDPEFESPRQAVRELFQIKKRSTATYEISCEGKWDHLQSQARTIEIPIDQAWQINTGELEPVAQVTVTGWEDEEAGILAAMFPLGKGHITVISNPYLASNANLIEADNCVLLTHLMTDMRQRVIFDEFYHGLTVRGNALWLLSKRPYAIITVSVLMVVGVWVWRNAIFLGPSRDDMPVSRRTLGEYLEAMSRFLLKGKESSKYILRELRDGVLWHYSKTLGLASQQQNVDVVIGLLSRRSPHKATQLEAALKHADVVLNNPRARKDEILLATRKVSDCLST